MVFVDDKKMLTVDTYTSAALKDVDDRRAHAEQVRSDVEEQIGSRALTKKYSLTYTDVRVFTDINKVFGAVYAQPLEDAAPIHPALQLAEGSEPKHRELRLTTKKLGRGKAKKKAVSSTEGASDKARPRLWSMYC